jgi:hypothetical protein
MTSSSPRLRLAHLQRRTDVSPDEERKPPYWCLPNGRVVTNQANGWGYSARASPVIRNRAALGPVAVAIRIVVCVQTPCRPRRVISAAVCDWGRSDIANLRGDLHEGERSWSRTRLGRPDRECAGDGQTSSRLDGWFGLGERHPLVVRLVRQRLGNARRWVGVGLRLGRLRRQCRSQRHAF